MLGAMKERDQHTEIEAAALKAAFQEWKKGGPGRTQEAVAEALGFAGQSAVSQYLNGRIPLNLSALLGFAGLFRVNPSSISERLAPRGSALDRNVTTPPAQIGESTGRYQLAPVEAWSDDTPLAADEVALPFYKGVELSAGKGKEAMLECTGGSKLRFGARTLRNHGVEPAAAVATTVHGNSMAPVMPDGCTVAFNTAATNVVDGKIYAINHAGELRIKLLYRLPAGGLRVRSYNDAEYPDEVYTSDDAASIIILGRVFWYSVLL